MTPATPPPVTDAQLFNLFRWIVDATDGQYTTGYIRHLARTGLVLLERRARALHTTPTLTVPTEVEEAENAVSK